MKKNYSMPQLEVSEMKAGALLQSSTGGTVNTNPVSGSEVGGIGVGGTSPKGSGETAKITPNHFEF